AADRVLVLAHFFDQCDHTLGRHRVGAAHRRRLDLLKGDAGRVRDVGVDVTDLLDVAEDLDALASEELLGDGRRRYSADRLAGARAPAAPVVAEAVLGVKGIIGMARTVLVLDIAVIVAAL